MTAALDTAIQLSYLMEGFNDANRANRETLPDTYDLHANIHGGHIGITADFYDLAEIVAQIRQSYISQDFPGVFEYEVTQDLGDWLFYHPQHTILGFETHARGRAAVWFSDGLAGQADLEGSGADHSAGDSNHVELNPSQQVDGKKESTMKVDDLISTLQNIRDDHGNVDVVVRGSTPKGFVDAQEVRSVKTTKRRVVYIGKPSPGRDAQE